MTNVLMPQNEVKMDCKRLVTVRMVKPWTKRQHEEVDFYMTQFLSVHGHYRSYLHKMGKFVFPNCVYGLGDGDYAADTFVKNDRWAPQRKVLEAEIGQLSPDTVVKMMPREEETWNRASHYVTGILKVKKLDLDRKQTNIIPQHSPKGIV